MKAMLRQVRDKDVKYQALMFVCPGCVVLSGGMSGGLHMLPVNTTVKSPSWEWNGNLERPTLKPSVLSGKNTGKICHSYLTEGRFQFLSDCTHPLKDQTVEMPDLPDWVVN